jgi:thioester reductase-like protein
MPIAITGATGLLGTRLLEILAERHDSVVLLSRPGGVPARERIVRYLRASGRPDDDVAAITSRLRTEVVELERPMLGLTEQRFRALADELDEIWHCAASIDLNSDPQRLHRVNTIGTRRVIELADAGSRLPMLHHVSTIGVAGRRPVGRIHEEDLDDSYGFTTRYEESKYLAEIAVREWSARTGRPAVVHRPSVLVTDQRPHPHLPPHPLLTGMQLTRKLVASFVSSAPGDRERLVVRVPGDPQALVNMLQVDEAARLMVEVAAHAPTSRVDTYHIVHPRDVRMGVLADVFEELFEQMLPISWRFVPSAPRQPTPWESLVYQTMSTFLPFVSYRRRFDDHKLRQLGLTGDFTPPVDRDYLMRSFGSEQYTMSA